MSLGSKKSLITAAWRLGESTGTRAAAIGGSGCNLLVSIDAILSEVWLWNRRGAVFNAVNTNYLTTASVPAVELGNTTWMIRFWTKMPIIQPAAKGMMVAKSGTTHDFYIGTVNANNILYFVLFDASVAAKIITHPTTLQIDTPYLVHAWHDATTRNMGLALNGVPATLVSTAGFTPIVSSASFTVGARTTSGDNYYFTGTIQDLLVMKGGYLTNAEMLEDFKLGYTNITDPGLPYDKWDGARELSAKKSLVIGHWKMDEATNTTRVNNLGSGGNLGDASSCPAEAGKWGRNCVTTVASSTDFLVASGNPAVASLSDFDWMVRCWLKLTSSTAGVVTCKDSASLRNWAMYAGGAAGISADMFNSAGSGVSATSNTALANGQWCLGHMWHDATNNYFGVAMNGATKQVVSTGGLVPNGASTSDFYVGRRGFPGSELYFDGSVQDLIIMQGGFLNGTERLIDYYGSIGVPFDLWGSKGLDQGRLVESVYTKGLVA